MVALRTESRQGEGEAAGGKPAAALAALLRSGDAVGAYVIAAFVTVLLVWWAWKQGAYFGSVFLPGAILVFSLLIVFVFSLPFNGRLRGAAGVAVAALVALAGWTLFSIAWTSFNDAAVQDAERAILYAAVFLLGIWCCNLSGRRRLLPLAVVAITGAVIGIVATVTLAGGTDVPRIFHDDATLRFPIGYRNAEGAFLMICLWPLMALAASKEPPWWLRAMMIGVGTMLLDLAVLTESRGVPGAAVIALAVFLAASRQRLRVASFLALAALPVLAALPTLLDVFQHGGDGRDLIPLMRDSARAIALTSLGSVVLAAICIKIVEPRLDLGPKRTQIISQVAAALALVVVLVGGGIFVGKRGGPLGFINQRVQEFKHEGNPNLQAGGTRFGVHVGSNRDDFWRVSLDQGRDHPLLGGGAGSFQIAYLRHRRSLETPKDPHSVEMLMFSELGIVGLGLFGTFVIATGIAGARSRTGLPSTAALSAGALASGAYWLVHASYDWFWHYPAVTATAMFLLGTAVAPSTAAAATRAGPRLRYTTIGVFGVALLIAIPLFFSQRYADRAYDEAAQDPAAALSDLDRAASWDPYDATPLLAKGFLEARFGRPADAIVSYRDGLGRNPDDYATHLFLARVYASRDPAAARSEAAEALRLNPIDPQVLQLNRRLRHESG